MAGAIGALLILVLAVSMLMGGGKSSEATPARADALDSYFLNLEMRVSSEVSVKTSEETAKTFLSAGKDRLSLANLNRDARFQALIYFLKAKESIRGLSPKPALWDEVNPLITDTKRSIKEAVTQSLSDAFLAEKSADNDKALSIYQVVLDMVPDPNVPYIAPSP
ncbi:MAG: hypothetical protein MZV63_63530 [Marinilabiliales bacterium]|nr:hypothetical protein [Marinilabiliales bacterium]